MGNFNSLIFPAPKPPFYEKGHMNLVYVPRITSKDKTKSRTQKPDKKNKNAKSYICGKARTLPPIPCMLIAPPTVSKCTHVIIYFHGNASDIGCSPNFFSNLLPRWNAFAIAMEYPGYGVYKSQKLSPDNIAKDAEAVYDYLTIRAGIKPQQIIIFGRSMGSGPACRLARRREVKALILMSAYMSVQKAAKSLVGCFGCCVRERFRNFHRISALKIPILFLHGKKDRVIPCEHSQHLFGLATQSVLKRLVLREGMTHNEYSTRYDLIEPVKAFLVDIGVLGVAGLEVVKFGDQVIEEMTCGPAEVEGVPILFTQEGEGNRAVMAKNFGLKRID